MLDKKQHFENQHLSNQALMERIEFYSRPVKRYCGCGTILNQYNKGFLCWSCDRLLDKKTKSVWK